MLHATPAIYERFVREIVTFSKTRRQLFHLISENLKRNDVLRRSECSGIQFLPSFNGIFLRVKERKKENETKQYLK